ncbi:MAG: ATP-binding cassette domain-containing protein [Candidatus Heimdallarchaeota archaeon]|nr:ATP-binding cassette domain-containing protein [Candidatus Heimdallarchaeota archaeon]MDH5644727.1 ATP-binding cassette domain-containing protein [Candidatus Heimdallarchaeota archaeon]
MATVDHSNNYIFLHDIHAGYKGIKILNNINLNIKKGSITAIIGPSGAGKTTLFKIILGLLRPSNGKITIDGVSPTVFNKKHGKIGYIPQNLGLIKNLTVKSNILLGALGRTSNIASLLNLFSIEDHEMCEEILNSLEIKSKENQKITSLSGGQKKRVAIARAFMNKPDLLIADEFLSELDDLNIKKVMNLVKNKAKETNMTVILVEHDIGTALKYTDQIVLVKDGEIKGVFESNQVEPSILDEVFYNE